MSAMQIGKFEVIGPLGTGAHSTILQIRRKSDSKNYALKVVPIDGPEDMKFYDQAEHELRVAGMLNHPNLVQVYALEKVRNWIFRVKKVHLLIEYVNGKTLDTVGPIPLPHLVQIFVQVAEGLNHMHRQGVFHADLKPNNIILSKANQAKIIDYGLAWIRGEGKGRIQGTPEYMAPEQSKHKMVNERTDMYNFGAALYRMLTFRHPPATVSLEDGGIPVDGKMWKRMFTPVQEHNATAPEELCSLVHQCLSYNARKRPETMSEIQGKLDRIADDLKQSSDDELENFEW